MNVLSPPTLLQLAKLFAGVEPYEFSTFYRYPDTGKFDILQTKLVVEEIIKTTTSKTFYFENLVKPHLIEFLFIGIKTSEGLALVRMDDLLVSKVSTGGPEIYRIKYYILGSTS